jgi:hypothetical protein
MLYVIGTDEAGYGPNLGPLVISATRWRLPTDELGTDLYQLLADTVTRDPPTGAASERVAVADSKRLYTPHAGLANLEYGIGAALYALGECPQTVGDVWSRLSPAAQVSLSALPWPHSADDPFPRAADGCKLQRLGEVFRQGLEDKQVGLDAIRCRTIFPEEFNETVERLGNKAEALSRWTLQLVSDLFAGTGHHPVLIHCDKHGGRNRYASLLQLLFPDQLIQVRAEGRACSWYRCQQGERRIEARFVARGEEFLPAALASMASKYLRELAMSDLNAFWRQHLPHLQPTAGYPVDARRFMAEIETLRQQLGIPKRVLWRDR